jgi:hypothetical protein
MNLPGNCIGNPFVSADKPIQERKNENRNANDHANVDSVMISAPVIFLL